MKKTFFSILKLSLTSIFLITFLTSCSKNHYSKVISGHNDFYGLVNGMVDKMSPKLKKHLDDTDVVLVSDFVNLDKLKNRSKLGFLLSDSLKTALSDKDIIVREIELREQFEYGKRGLNVLTRELEKIAKKEVNIKYALVGTYSITTESLILFIKLIELDTGNILTSRSGQTSVDNEIIELESEHKKRKISVYAPMTL